MEGQELGRSEGSERGGGVEVGEVREVGEVGGGVRWK